MPQDHTHIGPSPNADATITASACVTVNTPFAIVGIGASAGGLAAFSAFFGGIPTDRDPGMAFVVVQHLAPDHESILSELIQRNTRIKVIEVEDGMRVQINCAYIIPPNRDMAFLNGTLTLLVPSAARGHRLPVDYLFRSLAQDQRERAIGIVLSGTGRDGTLGIQAIKAQGGMVMAQTPESSAFDGMPSSAMATGLVDFSLPPNEMPAQLMSYISHAFGKLGPMAASAPQSENVLKQIFILLRDQTGHDFSQYKPSTICRRIERRMAVHQIVAIGDYVKYLQHAPKEVEALFRDVLIGVTSFFRDPESFTVLERRVIPKMMVAKAAGAAVRVWSCGCSTGEEAISIAILLHEHMQHTKQIHPVQIFATDIDNRAITQARTGIFPASSVSDMSSERLAHFFTAENEGANYRLNKVIRDLLVFSEHNVIKSPPFSKLDLIACRNVLIYLGTELQKKLIALFHYALIPGGILFLGSSETVGDCGDLFLVLDRTAKLYQRKEDFQGAKRAALMRFLAPHTAAEMSAKAGAGTVSLPKHTHSAKQSLRELTEQSLLAQMAQVAALVNGNGDVLYLHGRTGMYLEPTPGDTGINNVLKMARMGLGAALTTCLHQAVTSKAHVYSPGLRVKTNGDFTLVNLTICPMPKAALAAPYLAGNLPAHESKHEVPLYLVILEPALSSDTPLAVPADDHEANSLISKLHEQLSAKDAFLQLANQALETSNEELKSSNEEMQSINEELQSTNEELETSKEELQSINEELSTVNTELQSKVADLSRVNNDMNNLLAGTGIATIFVDSQLRILRFTPAATKIINLIPSDVGRPVGHLVSNLAGYDSLVSDVQAVLKSLVPFQVDVQTRAVNRATDLSAINAESTAKSADRFAVAKPSTQTYTLRILPYRTLDNVIEGAVISFVEVTEVVQAREALHAAKELMRLAVVVRDAHDAILVQDLNGQITAWNPGAVRMYGWSETEALTMNTRERIPEALRDAALARVHQLSQAQILEPCRTQRIAKGGSILEISLISTALFDASGLMYAIATTERLAQALTHD